MGTLTVSFIVLVVVLVAGHRIRHRKRLAEVIVKQLTAPSQDIAAQFEEAGFIWYPNPSMKKPHRGPKDDDVVFTARTEVGCGACKGTVYLLRTLRPGTIFFGGELVDFGNVCAHCHLLHRDEWDPPDRIRYAWQDATDLSDFLARLKRGPGQPEETLVERKARLEKELSRVDTRRDHLRSQLLSVKNQLGEPEDKPPHR